MYKKTAALLLAIGLICALPGCGEQSAPSIIIESNSISEVQQQIAPDEYTPDTLVVFDIDNTVAATPTDLGSDQWFSALFSEQLAAGKNTPQALSASLPPYYHAQHLQWLEPVETDTVPMIKTLQDRNVTVISLTARGFYLIYRTLEQLARLSIDFSKTSPAKAMAPYGVENPAIYVNGIIFASAQHKGDVLKHWIAQQKMHPKKIIFVDDKMKNVASVQQAMKTAGHPFVGIRYGNLDEQVFQFDMQKTNGEYQQLLERISDRKPIALVL